MNKYWLPNSVLSPGFLYLTGCRRAESGLCHLKASAATSPRMRARRWLEAGNVWQTSGAIGHDLIYTATAALAAGTKFGVLWLAYGMADDGNGSFFIKLGQRF